MKASEEVELELTTRASLAQRLKNTRPGLEIHGDQIMLYLLLEDIFVRLEEIERRLATAP